MRATHAPAAGYGAFDRGVRPVGPDTTRPSAESPTDPALGRALSSTAAALLAERFLRAAAGVVAGVGVRDLHVRHAAGRIREGQRQPDGGVHGERPGAVRQVLRRLPVHADRLDREHDVLDVDLVGVARLATHDHAARHRAGDVLPGRVARVADAVPQRGEGAAAQIQVPRAGAGWIRVERALVDDGGDDRLAAVGDLGAGPAVIDGLEVRAARAGDGREVGREGDVLHGVRVHAARLVPAVAAGRAIAEAVLAGPLAEVVPGERGVAVERPPARRRERALRRAGAGAARAGGPARGPGPARPDGAAGAGRAAGRARAAGGHRAAGGRRAAGRARAARGDRAAGAGGAAAVADPRDRGDRRVIIAAAGVGAVAEADARSGRDGRVVRQRRHRQRRAGGGLAGAPEAGDRGLIQVDDDGPARGRAAARVADRHVGAVAGAPVTGRGDGGRRRAR